MLTSTTALALIAVSQLRGELIGGGTMEELDSAADGAAPEV